MWAFLLWFAVVASAAEPLWNGPGVNLLGGPSRDGKILSYVDPATRNLAIRDLATELCVIGTDGANSQTIFRNEEAGFVQPWLLNHERATIQIPCIVLACMSPKPREPATSPKSLRSSIVLS